MRCGSPSGRLKEWYKFLLFSNTFFCIDLETRQVISTFDHYAQFVLGWVSSPLDRRSFTCSTSTLAFAEGSKQTLALPRCEDIPAQVLVLFYCLVAGR